MSLTKYVFSMLVDIYKLSEILDKKLGYGCPRIQGKSSCVSKIFLKLIRFGQISNICVILGFLVVSRMLARH